MTSIQTRTDLPLAAPVDSTGAERAETVVLGAGQTGLATAYYLGRAGSACVVLDEHRRVGDQWRTRYDSLRLNTPAKYDGLPGLPLPAARHDFPTGAPDGRLARGVRRAVRDGRRGTTPRCPAWNALGDAYLVTTDRGDLPGRQRRRRDRRRAPPAHAGRRALARPGHPAAPLQRLPQPRASCCPDRCWSSGPASPAPTSPWRSPARARDLAVRQGALRGPGRHRAAGRAGRRSRCCGSCGTTCSR